MSNHPFADLPQRGKAPGSKRDLDAWITQAVSQTGIVERRLSWMVASSVVIIALQRALHTDGKPRFLLKGGTYLEIRLGLHTRATKDVDTMFRGDFEEFIAVLDSCLEPWGPFEITRTKVDTINNVSRIIKPRRFTIQLNLKGRVWRAIDIEVAPEEGDAGSRVESMPAPPLEYFGLPSVVLLAGIALDYQVAQKIHACSDPHQPPESKNDRVRDVVDLLLLRDAKYGDTLDLRQLRQACIDVFAARYVEAEQLQIVPRSWPPTVVAYQHWQADFRRIRDEIGFAINLADAVVAVNDWISVIDAASQN